MADHMPPAPQEVTLLLDHEPSLGTNAEDNNAAAQAFLQKNAPANNPP